jgi:protoporphyrinogen oxidase
MMKNIAIIGAGPMGLTTAYYLTNHGYKPVIFESDDRIGGMSASFNFNGQDIERYYHFINLPDKYLFSLLKELNIYESLRWNQTRMGLFCEDNNGNMRIYNFENPFDLLKFNKTTLISRLRYGFHIFASKFLRNLKDLDNISAKEWIINWEGKEGYEHFWRALFEKKFFELSDPLSAAWIASRIRRVANSRHSIFHESLGFLEGGTQLLLNKLENHILDKGGKILLNSQVTHIEISGDKGGGKIRTVDLLSENFDIIVLTIPLPYLSNIISNLPFKYLNRVTKIQNIGCVCVIFELKKPLTDKFWLNIDIKDWEIPGIIEYSNLRRLKSSYVYIPFYSPHSHANWMLNNEEFILKARKYIKVINQNSAETEVSASAFRYNYAQPVCPPGFLNILPDYQTGLLGILAADTSHSYFEDRSINESIRIAKELSDIVIKI